MDLNETFIKIQGVLNSIEKTTGPLRQLKNRGGNEVKIRMVCTQLYKYFVQKKLLSKEGLPSNEVMLKKITLFLILNCDLTDSSSFKDNVNVGHLVGICPLISPCLLMDLVWGLSLDKSFSELISFCPVMLSLELLKGAITSIKFANPYPLLERVRLLISAIYTKIYQLQTDTIYYIKLEDAIAQQMSKLIELLQNYITPDSAKMDDWDMNELYRYTGYAMKNILQLIHECLALFINKPATATEDVYKITYQLGAEFYYSPQSRQTLVFNGLQEANKLLLTAAEANLKSINVSIYCAWAEFVVENTKTLQQVIANYAYLINEQIQQLDLESEFKEELTSIFESIALKPEDVHDQIESSDLANILRNALIENNDQKLWFGALINSSCVLSNLKTIETIRKLTHLCQASDVKHLIQTCYDLKSSPPSHFDTAKEVVLLCLATLPVDEQINLVTSYFVSNGVNNTLERLNFNANLTEIFNKDISSSVCTLLIQSPTNLLKRILKEALKDESYVIKMLTILRSFQAICCLTEDATNDSNLSLIYLAFKSVCEEIDFTECKSSTFVLVLSELLSTELLSSSYVSKELFFPVIHKDLTDGLPNKVLFWLEIVNGICCDEKFSSLYLPFVIFLSEILKKCRGDISTFSLENMSIVQIVLSITNKVVVKNQKKKLLTENQISYLNRWMRLVPVQNKYYFEILWNDSRGSLFNSLWLGTLSEHSESWNTARMIELLPFSTQDEWREITKEMMTERHDALAVNKLFNNFFILMSGLLKKSPSSPAGTCLEYCIRNYAVVLKEILIPHCSDSYNAQLTIWENLHSLMVNLPASIKQSSSLTLVHILLPLLESLRLKNENVLSSAVLNMVEGADLEANRIICEKIIEKAD